eukprot:scaffold100019_cov80-Phaeocystis_antarctica.AAC.3
MCGNSACSSSTECRSSHAMPVRFSRSASIAETGTSPPKRPVAVCSVRRSGETSTSSGGP